MSVPLYLVECDNIPGSISEENKVRMMVLPIIAMLVITMVVAGWQYEDIQVQEGTNEMEVEVPPYPEQKIIQDSVSATSYINNENNFIEINIEARFWKPDFGFIVVSVESELDPDMNPSDLVIQSEITDAPEMERTSISFHELPDEDEIQNLSIWSHEDFILTSSGGAPSHIGFEITGNHFSFNEEEVTVMALPWDVFYDEDEKVLESQMTVEITATIEGLSEDVETSARINYIPKVR